MIHNSVRFVPQWKLEDVFREALGKSKLWMAIKTPYPEVLSNDGTQKDSPEKEKLVRNFLSEKVSNIAEGFLKFCSLNNQRQLKDWRCLKTRTV